MDWINLGLLVFDCCALQKPCQVKGMGYGAKARYALDSGVLTTGANELYVLDMFLFYVSSCFICISVKCLATSI